MNEKKYLQKIVVLVLCLALSITSLPAMPAKAQSMNNLVTAATTNPKIGFTSSRVMLPIGESQAVKFVTKGKVVSYRTGDASIASVDKYGKVKGLKRGWTNVYATCNGKVYRCNLVVYEKRISVTETAKTINQEETILATLKNRNENETLQCVVKDAAIVDAKVGGITGDKVSINLIPKKAGTTVITLKRNKSVEEQVVKVTVVERKELSGVDIYKKCSQAMVEIHMKNAQGEEGLGSGFFIDKNKIITNYHVLEGVKSLTVVDYDGVEYPVQYLYDYNEELDLAILGVDANHKSMEISYAPVATGDRIFAIGSPYGLTGTLSTGLISKAYRTLDTDIVYTQITASISRGNSGGALINRFGEVIGVNTFTRSEGQNLNFAVPITYLKELSTSSPSKISEFYEQTQ